MYQEENPPQPPTVLETGKALNPVRLSDTSPSSSSGEPPSSFDFKAVNSVCRSKFLSKYPKGPVRDTLSIPDTFLQAFNNDQDDHFYETLRWAVVTAKSGGHDAWEYFEHCALNSYFKGMVLPTKCKCRGSRPNSVWKHHHCPLPLEYPDSVLAQQYILDIVRSLQVFTITKLKELAEITASHCLINPLCLHSTKDKLVFDSVTIKAFLFESINPDWQIVRDFVLRNKDMDFRLHVMQFRLYYEDFDERDLKPTQPAAKRDVVPCMDTFKSATNLFGLFSETKGAAKETLEEANAFMEHVRTDGVTVNSPSVDNLAEVINNNINVDSRHIDNLSDTLKAGINVTHKVPLFESITGWLGDQCAPLKTLFNHVDSFSGAKKEAMCLIVCTSLELIRLKAASTSKWFNALAVLSLAVAFKYGSKVIQTFVGSYYGTMAFKTLYAYYLQGSFSFNLYEDSDDDSLPVPAIAFSDSCNSRSLVQIFSETFVSIITGITEKATIRDVCIALNTYKTLVNGFNFTMDSLANLCIDFVNLLGSPFGVKIFRRAYSKYPQMYILLDYTFEVKDILDKATPFSPVDKDKFVSMCALLRSLQLSIPICSENTVYLNALSKLENKMKDLEIVLKARGLIGSRRRFRPWSFMIVGCSGCAKTRQAPLIVDNLFYEKYGPEQLLLMKQNADAYFYSMKAGKKYHDSFQTSVKSLGIDDHGQIRRATDPETCVYVQDIYIENNETYTLNAANVNLKDTLYVRPEITYRTSNASVFNIDNTWITEQAAWLSRVECNNGGVILCEPLPEYQVEEAGAWKYTANQALRSKRKFDPSAASWYLYDLRPGSKIPLANGAGKKDAQYTGNGKKGPAMDWAQLNRFLSKNFRMWEANERAKYIADFDSYNDPVINPLMVTARNKPIQVNPASDFPRRPQFMRTEEYADLSKEELLALLEAKNSTTPMARPLLCHYNEYENFSNALHDYYASAIDLHTKRGGGTLLFSAISRMCWGSIVGDKWAEVAISQREAIDRALYDHVKDNPLLGMVYPTEVLGGAAQIMDYDLRNWFEVVSAGIVDIYSKCIYMTEMTGKSMGETVEKVSKLTWKKAISASMEDLGVLFSDLWLTYLDTVYTATSILCFENYWVSWIGSALAGVLLASKALEVTACADSYERIGKTVKNPLTNKCKHSNMKVKDCQCAKCVTFKGCLKNYNPGGSNLANCSCTGCTVPAQVKPAFETFNTNAQEELEGLAKRNVWNLQFLSKHKGEILAAQNITMVCTQIGVTTSHFILECMNISSRVPAGLLNFTNWNGSRNFEVIFEPSQWKIDYITDKAFWINTQYCSFGGGLRTILNNFVSRNDPPIHAGRLIKMKYDRDTKELRYELVRVKVGIPRPIVYEGGGQNFNYNAIEVDCLGAPGMCGAPIMTADSVIKQPKFFGIIVAGSKADEGVDHAYVTSLCREELYSLVEEYEIELFDTSHLPSAVVSTNVVPCGFVVNSVAEDKHSVMMFNPITATKLKDCAGPIDVMPTFITPWERNDGQIIYPMELNRLKSVTDGPPANPFIYHQAVIMAAQGFSHYLPEGRRAYRLSTMEAIEGAMDEARFSTRTSPGGKYILKGITKKQIVKLKDDGKGSTVFDFSSPEGQEFLEDIRIATEERERGIISLSYANEFPKAEVIPRNKVYAGKVRAVRGDDQDQVIADKKELACLSYLLKRSSIASGLVVGKDPLSHDFDLMARMLQIFRNIDAADHSGWDTNYFRYKYQGVFTFIKFILHDATPVHLKAIETCINNMLYKLHLAHIRVASADGGPLFVNTMVIFEILHGMISGSYNTLNFNTIGHFIDFRYVCLCLYAEKILGVPYLQYRPATHGMIPFTDINKSLISFICGDDILSTVSCGLSYINFESMRDMYGNHNMVLTTDKKDGESSTHIIERYSPIPADFGFCKRTPRYCVEYSMYVWCLSIVSLLKSIYYSEDFSDHEQVIDTFFRELSLWGRKEFDIYAPKVRNAVSKYYSYDSPFSVYEISLMFALGGLNKKRALKLYLSVSLGEIDPTFMSAYDISMIESGDSML